ncbi:hypothetical protein [Corynebacterium heidelbergense]|uniref:hypothetical protein n=1 Tax=Corynebacterium heidelbergense TaxID=2055947 RepID=UPI001EE76463|nr:hypothetical protein [Corynebacterium heidelbergense]WCZ37270.1 hypothetical protein CHEID_08700 [Corynebacterium heidelbergense]
MAELRAVSQAGVIEDLRRKIGKMSGAANGAASGAMNGAGVVTVPEWLGAQLTAGGLPRASVTAMANCPAALVDVLAGITAAGGCAAVVGYPSLALAAVAAGGGNIDRLVVIPDPAPHAGAVLGTLVEGLDLVIYAPATPVTPTFARPVEARLRRSSCALISVGTPWPGAILNLDMKVQGVLGLGRGSGRIRGIQLTGKVWGKAQPPRTFEAVVGEARQQSRQHHRVAPRHATMAHSMQRVAQ